MRKIGGYLILSGLFGGWFGMLAYKHGVLPALFMTGVSATFLGMLALAAYLLQENT